MYSFFIDTFLPPQQVFLGEYLIATRDFKGREACVTKGMLGEIVGIIDNTQSSAIIQIFPLEIYSFNEEHVRINAFVKASTKQKAIIGGKENFKKIMPL